MNFTLSGRDGQIKQFHNSSTISKYNDNDWNNNKSNDNKSNYSEWEYHPSLGLGLGSSQPKESELFFSKELNNYNEYPSQAHSQSQVNENDCEYDPSLSTNLINREGSLSPDPQPLQLFNILGGDGDESNYPYDPLFPPSDYELFKLNDSSSIHDQDYMNINTNEYNTNKPASSLFPDPFDYCYNKSSNSKENESSDPNNLFIPRPSPNSPEYELERSFINSIINNNQVSTPITPISSSNNYNYNSNHTCNHTSSSTNPIDFTAISISPYTNANQPSTLNNQNNDHTNIPSDKLNENDDNSILLFDEFWRWSSVCHDKKYLSEDFTIPMCTNLSLYFYKNLPASIKNNKKNKNLCLYLLGNKIVDKPKKFFSTKIRSIIWNIRHSPW